MDLFELQKDQLIVKSITESILKTMIGNQKLFQLLLENSDMKGGSIVIAL